MTLDLLIDTFSLSLEHIGSILGVLEQETFPKYPLGLKVRYVDDYGLFKVVYFGEICGFEYFSTPKFMSLGWSYNVDVKFSRFLFKDGTERFCCHDYELLSVHESDIQEYVMEFPAIVDRSVAL